MPALEINIESYHEVPKDEFLSVKYTPANSQDPKGEKSSGNHLGRGTHLHSRGKAQRGQAMCLSSHSQGVGGTISLPFSLFTRGINSAFNGNCTSWLDALNSRRRYHITLKSKKVGVSTPPLGIY